MYLETITLISFRFHIIIVFLMFIPPNVWHQE